MRTKISSILIVLLATASIAMAGKKEVKINVNGNCGMCEERIEKAVNNLDGVSSASWDKASQMLTVSIDENIDVMTVHNAVAKVGHDTDKVKADESTYNSLPGCCKYDRKDVDKKAGCGEAKKSGCCGGH